MKRPPKLNPPPNHSLNLMPQRGILLPIGRNSAYLSDIPPPEYNTRECINLEIKDC